MIFLKKNLSPPKKTRNSSLELLKVTGILMIVLSHVIQTLNDTNKLVGYNDYILRLAYSSADIQQIILACLRHSGAVGNTIFFVCSAWFLLQSSKANKAKAFHMIADTWVISVIIFIVFKALGDYTLDWKMTLKQFLPVTFGNNWYITIYILFFLIHPLLNKIIESLSKRDLLTWAIISTVVFSVINTVSKFFAGTNIYVFSNLMLWIAIYFDIAYIKFYAPKFADNRKASLIMFISGFMLTYGTIILINFTGMNNAFLHGKVISLNMNSNPFIILMVIGLFNFTRTFTFRSKLINYISSLSLLIYIIHENSLFRVYYRPYMWQYVYEHFGYNYVLVWAFVIGAVVFAGGLAASIVYSLTMQKATLFVTDKTYPLVRKAFYKLEDKIMKIK